MFYKVVDAILLFGGKDTIFPRNFQGFWEKCRYDDKEKKAAPDMFENRLVIEAYLHSSVDEVIQRCSIVCT